MSPPKVSRSNGLCPARAAMTLTSRNTIQTPSDGAIWKPARNERYLLAFFLSCVALLTIGADGPPDALDTAATHTRIVVIPAGKVANQRHIVALASPACDTESARPPGTPQGILLRELMRQALLIAARDELGLSTRDEVLGDAIAAAIPAGSDVELVTVFHTAAGKLNRAVISAPRGHTSTRSCNET